MTEVHGTIIACDGARALVRVGEGCGRCHEPGGCGGIHLARAFCPSSQGLHWVHNPRGARLGEEVSVVVHERALFRGALAGYLLPLLGVFLGAASGSFFAGESGSMLGAAGGLAAAWGFQRTRRMRDFLAKPDFEPHIISRRIDRP